MAVIGVLIDVYFHSHAVAASNVVIDYKGGLSCYSCDENSIGDFHKNLADI